MCVQQRAVTVIVCHASSVNLWHLLWLIVSMPGRFGEKVVQSRRERIIAGGNSRGDAGHWEMLISW